MRCTSPWWNLHEFDSNMLLCSPRHWQKEERSSCDTVRSAAGPGSSIGLGSLGISACIARQMRIGPQLRRVARSRIASHSTITSGPLLGHTARGPHGDRSILNGWLGVQRSNRRLLVVAGDRRELVEYPALFRSGCNDDVSSADDAGEFCSSRVRHLRTHRASEVVEAACDRRGHR